MDTVSMLNTMRFYCQPILPLVYDESMSYYETLCKVVGQLNTTGETVNKLNEGLTNEIADRQAADAALDERLKTVESTNAKIHFMAFAGTPPYDAKPIYAMPTRSELRHWVTDGDMIVTLMQTTDEGRNIVYAASCAYNAPNWENASFDGFNIIVPISTDYDSEGDYAVRQKIAKITIPPASAASLDEKWGLQFIEINTPHTSAEGMVNFTATVVGETVTASITPAEFIKLFDVASATAKLCVGVNARLNYNALELSSSVATVYDNSSAKREVRITFVQDPHAGRHDYVPSEIFDLVNIVGDKDTNTWKVETFGTELFDFQRYEGFRFTRKAGDVIEAAEDCDPASVAQYYNELPGKDYQNLPVHLIDEVDNADYWNGTFDSYSDGHITFTFTTANYATIGEKMVVRVIELSATRTGAAWAGDEKWSYAAKEFVLPISSAPEFVVKIWPADELNESYSLGLNAYTADVEIDKTFEEISAAFAAGSKLTAKIYRESQKVNLVDTTNDIRVSIAKESPNFGSVRIHFKQINAGFSNHGFANTTPIVALDSTDSGESKYVIFSEYVLPAPYGEKDEGKVPVVQGNMWALKDVNATSVFVVDFWATGSETYDSDLKAYTIPLASNSTYDDIYKLVNGGAEFIAHIYQEAERINLVGSSDDYEVYGDNTLGNITFKFIRAVDSGSVTGFDSVADYALLIKTETFTEMLLVIKQLTLPVPNSDGSDNGKVPTIINGKWELKTPLTYANGNEVAY